MRETGEDSFWSLYCLVHGAFPNTEDDKNHDSTYTVRTFSELKKQVDKIPGINRAMPKRLTSNETSLRATEWTKYGVVGFWDPEEYFGNLVNVHQLVDFLIERGFKGILNGEIVLKWSIRL